MRKTTFFAGYLIVIVLAACVATPYDLAGSAASLEIRSVQTREYDNLDQPMMMRAVIATLQDFGFTIDQADTSLGIVTGTRAETSAMRITVTVAQVAPDKVSVRANARLGENSIKAAETYQDFFVALDKAMFLVRNSVD